MFDARWLTDQTRADVENALATGAVLKADKLQELAPKFGADAKVFTATVNRYNDLIELAHDLDFCKGSDSMTAPIPGLYAAGNIAGSFWGDTYPMGFLGGVSRSHVLVFSRVAGLHAARQ